MYAAIIRGISGFSKQAASAVHGKSDEGFAGKRRAEDGVNWNGDKVAGTLQ
jgi:hypothetical protein